MDGANYGQELMAWEIPDYIKHERNKLWYVMVFFIVISLLILCFKTPNFLFSQSNFLFAIIIILSSVILIMNDTGKPQPIDFIIATEGIVVDTSFFDYDMIDHFCIIYKPNDEVRAIYLTFHNFLRPRLTIHLADQDPIKVRNFLARYIKEDLDRTDEPNTDFLSKKLKI